MIGIGIGSEVKIAAVILLLGALAFCGNKLYEAGYDEAVAANTDANLKATNLAIAAAKTEWSKSQDLTQKGIQNDEAKQTKIVYITQKAKSIAAPKCADVGSDFGGVYNQYIDTIQSDPNPSGRIPNAKVPGQ